MTAVVATLKPTLKLTKTVKCIAGPQEGAATRGNWASKWGRENICPWTQLMSTFTGARIQVLSFLVKQNGQQLETDVTCCPLKDTC